MSSLRGLRILNTRAVHQAASLTNAIKQRRGISIEIPLISIQSPRDKNKRSNQLNGIFQCDWVIFTSANGFYFTRKAIEECGYSLLDVLQTKKIAVVGKKTGKILEREGYSPALSPAQFDAEHLAEALIEESSAEETFFYPRSSQSRNVLTDRLAKSGRKIFDMVAYETVSNTDQQKRLNDLVGRRELDVILLTSPSAVRSFFSQLEKEHRPYVTSQLIFAAVGVVTAEALSRYDIEKLIIPNEFTLDAVLSKLVEYRENI
ncbi:hypothetical protein CR194_10910 [Salipaludibacillus keqinensis]|uniref:Uroporphyrinogen-III synthase n=1 Tax=Salipaludibacillus keqinensis TaxID=2045207 RepID=A0A323TGR1_9BACI|nr:uroporphyrinogen-III synthase [Salipaludibacillus keqinensis]PYZ93660.1 hypothetical protein CR194_10910 [Salipaludibacillus keqinensis]